MKIGKIVRKDGYLNIVEKTFCKWIRNDPEYNSWLTTCGKIFAIPAKTPEKNDMNFCPYCGGGILPIIDLTV